MLVVELPWKLESFAFNICCISLYMLAFSLSILQVLMIFLVLSFNLEEMFLASFNDKGC